MQYSSKNPENSNDKLTQYTFPAGFQRDRVVFLDRDGVINHDSDNYIKSWSEFTFIPRSIEAIHQLVRHGYSVIVITNQSVINRNMVSYKNLNYIHDMMKKTVENEGGRIIDIFFCPHIPENNCTCRKPKPGLIHQAQSKYNIHLNTAVMIGDNAKDIECAKNAGCKGILVKTGNAKQALTTLKDKHVHPDHIAKNLYEAVQWILSHKGNNGFI